MSSCILSCVPQTFQFNDAQICTKLRLKETLGQTLPPTKQAWGCGEGGGGGGPVDEGYRLYPCLYIILAGKMGVGGVVINIRFGCPVYILCFKYTLDSNLGAGKFAKWVH